MWEETYNRVDQAGADMLENFLNGTKNTFDSLKKMFIRTLAEMANAAWLRPITVQVMGALGSVFGVGGTALAYDSATGKWSMLQVADFSVICRSPACCPIRGHQVSSFLSYELPGTAPGISGLYGPTMGGGNLASGLSLGSALMYGGLGSLGYSLLGGALGLPQNKYSGITSGLERGLAHGAPAPRCPVRPLARRSAVRCLWLARSSARLLAGWHRLYSAAGRKHILPSTPMLSTPVCLARTGKPS
ncbi:MAG: hypothetical protein ACLR7Z_13850 [Bilophila wadsworthia]